MVCRRKRLKSSVNCTEEPNNGIAPVVADECSHFTASGRHKGMIMTDKNYIRHIKDDYGLPSGQPISWENCFRTLRVIYIEAVKKIRGSVYNQFVVRVSDGQFRASVEVKLLRIHISFLDSFHRLRKYQDEYVDRFDRNMKAMLRSGEMLYLLSDETRDLFDQAVADMTQKLQISDATEPVLQGVAGLSAQVRVCRRQIGELWKSRLLRGSVF